MKNWRYGFGCISNEIIEAIYKASVIYNEEMMVLCSRNQVDWDQGYVNNWDTQKFMKYITELRKKYPDNKVYICRDHCGIGYKDNCSDNQANVERTIDCDMDNGFDLIHVDCSKECNVNDMILKSTIQYLKYISSKKNKIELEVGTEENKVHNYKSIDEVENEIQEILAVSKPKYYTICTGNYISGMTQHGKIKLEYVEKIHDMLNSYGVLLKEHNADYLDCQGLSDRNGIVDAINVAPQLGIIQTLTIINKSMNYGININDYLEICYRSKKWIKWNTNSKDKLNCSIVCGHYNYTSMEYLKVIDELSKYENIYKGIIDNIVNYIGFVVRSFN